VLAATLRSMGVMALAASWCVVLLVGADPAVTGRTVCPSVAEIIDRLGPMLAPGAAFPSDGSVEIVDVPGRTIGALDVELRLRVGGSNVPLGVRRVERLGTCTDTADAVAVVAASWAGLYGTPVASRGIDRVGPDLSVMAAPASFARAAAMRLPSRTTLAVGASGGFVAGVAGGTAAVAGGEVGIQRGQWGVRLGAAETTERTLALGPGSATWHRLLVTPSLTLSTVSGRLYGEVAGGPVLARTITGGQGFATNTTDAALEVGLAPSVRLGICLEDLPVKIWLGDSAFVWLQPHEVSVVGLPNRAALPRFESWFSAGLTISFGS
jgi:hypothetical protein